MIVIFSLSGVSLPDLIRTKLANHLARAANLHTLELELARERAESYIESIEGATCTDPGHLEELFIAVVDVAATERREVLTS